MKGYDEKYAEYCNFTLFLHRPKSMSTDFFLPFQGVFVCIVMSLTVFLHTSVNDIDVKNDLQ